MVVPRFIGQAEANEPITVYGDGEQRRSFTWVIDAVRAMETLIQLPEAYGQIYNIGHNKDISINELAEMVKEITGSKSRISHVPYREAFSRDFEDMRRRQPDLSKLHAAIGYKPTRDLREMIEGIL
jgi:UDP-glucose 4-epimerase